MIYSYLLSVGVAMLFLIVTSIVYVLLLRVFNVDIDNFFRSYDFCVEKNVTLYRVGKLLFGTIRLGVSQRLSLAGSGQNFLDIRVSSVI